MKSQKKLKVYISVDMEGITDVIHWNETNPGDDYQYCRTLMTKEANSAVEGAIESGASEIVVRDAHSSARNIIPDMLNKKAKLIREWSGGPYSMMEGIDSSFDAAMFIGYHAKAMTVNATLNHTMSGSILDLKVNNISLPEAGWNGLIAGYCKVPVVFISGDKAICEQSKSIFDEIVTLPVKEGIGEASVNLHPEVSRELIKAGVKEALKNLKKFKPLKFDAPYTMQIDFKHENLAARLSYYPEARRVGAYGVAFTSNNFFEIMRFFMFR
jgi:D-amino peptidase